MEQHCRDSSTHNEGNSEVESFEILEFDEHEYDQLGWYDLHAQDHCHWSFAFTHASTSSKCILFAIRCLFQLNNFIKEPEEAECIVSEMIDWLKVRDPALIKEIFWNPDNWEEPNSRSSTTGSADCMDGGCTQ